MNTKKNFYLRKRFTMLELIVSMAILIVFLLFLTKFFTTTQELLSQSEAKNDQYRRARDFMDRLTQDCRQMYYQAGQQNMAFWQPYSNKENLQLLTYNSDPITDPDTKKMTMISVRSYRFATPDDLTYNKGYLYYLDALRKNDEKFVSNNIWYYAAPVFNLSSSSIQMGEHADRDLYCKSEIVGDVGSYSAMPEGVTWIAYYPYQNRYAPQSGLPENWGTYENDYRNNGCWRAAGVNQSGGVSDAIPNYMYVQFNVADQNDYDAYKKTGVWPTGYGKRVRTYRRFINIQR